MPDKMRGRLLLFAIVVVTLGAIGLLVAHSLRTPSPISDASVNSTTKVADRDTTPPPTTSTAVVKPRAPSNYMDVVRAEFPSLPTTQPLPVPLELNQAARIVLRVPIYLSKARGDLWLTRPDAATDSKVLKDAVDPNAEDSQTHVFSERVVFVHWSLDSAGNPVPYVVCRTTAGGYEVIWSQGRVPLASNREYRWSGAFSWDNDRAVVPCRSGISVIQFRPGVRESYRELVVDQTASAATHPSEALIPQVLFDGEGLLAWIPWEKGHAGTRGAIRYLNEEWVDLGPDQGWPQKLVHLVPLRDGTVFQFVAAGDGSITVQTTSLERAPVDEQTIEKLVAQLGDIDADVRRAAVTELANYGPGAWPVLTKLAEDEPPQAKLLLRELLKDKIHPTLSGMTLLGTRSLQLATHLSDGGVVFFAPQGVSIPDPNGDPATYAQAWLSVRPGHFVELLPPALVVDLKPESCGLDIVGDQWTANTDLLGPRLFYGNGFATLLRKSERQYSQVIGMDQRGRWLFRKPVDAGNTTSADATSDETLVIDPHLPDPTPRLPVWNLAIAETVGWDRDNWPVVQNGAAFALTDSDWRGLAKNEKFFTRLDPLTPHTPNATSPATHPSTRPTTEEAVQRPILTTADGARYYGGLTSLKVIERDGREIDWPLPAIANGTGPVTLISSKSGKLFLFNQPGRVLRIARNPDGAEPFRIEATFTRRIPSIKNPTRIWLDPAGRIDIAWENRLAILFPEGYIPRAISEKMLDQGGLDADSF